MLPKHAPGATKLMYNTDHKNPLKVKTLLLYPIQNIKSEIDFFNIHNVVQSLYFSIEFYDKSVPFFSIKHC